MLDQIVQHFVPSLKNIVFCLHPDMTLKMGFEKDLITKATNTGIN